MNAHKVLPGVAQGVADRPPSLPDGISDVWARHSDGALSGARRYAYADGCSYLLVGFGAVHSGRRDLIHTRLIGPRTRPFLIDDRPRLCVGARISPGFARAAFGIPASEFLDERVDYDQVYANADACLEALSSAESDAERVVRVLALARHQLRSAARIPATVRAAVAHISAADGRVRVSALADRLGITRQHLARQFAAHVGMSVKQFARVKRAEAARALATAAWSHGAAPVKWSMIAYQAGYYDQAHFIRDFKMLTGTTPARWAR